MAIIKIRLNGLGFTGEYACTMRCAKGFAIGNGRGVLGTTGRGGSEDEDADELEGRGSGVTSKLSSETSADGGGISNFGIGGRGGRCARTSSKDAAGEGGGSTNALVRCGEGGGDGAAILVLNSGSGLEGEGGMAGIDDGSTSVSYAGSTLLFLGDNATAPSPEDLRETRLFRGAAPLTLCFRGDLRVDGLETMSGEIVDSLVEEGPATAGVGGSSASICSTSHVRFSSRSFSRSACRREVQ